MLSVNMLKHLATGHLNMFIYVSDI